jgi:hypothetical protein
MIHFRKADDRLGYVKMKIFLSAVSSQFKACRDALRSDLSAIGAEVVVQEDFRQHGATLLEKLERYIASCDRIAIGDAGPRRLPLGRRYGFATRGCQANSRAATRDCGQQQLQRHCEAVRPCPRCHRRRHLKDYRRRRYDTVFGRLVVDAHPLMVAVIAVKDALPLRYRNCCPSR